MNLSRLAPVLLILCAVPLKAADDAAPKAAAPAEAAAAPAPPANPDAAPYTYGYNIGRTIASLGFSEGEMKAVLNGFHDAVDKKTAAYDTDAYQPALRELITRHLSEMSEKQKAAGKEFGEKFAAEKGVKELAGGGWYKQVKKGAGDAPAPTDTVKVHYRGTLLDGSEFDSSYKRNEPAVFPLNRVIPCWTNGVGMMKVGGKAKLVCPSNVAYGDQGHPPVIPGGATLIFEVELLDIVKPDAKPADSK